jgi:hypothetical protein
MSNEDHLWFNGNGEIDQGRVHNGNLFASNPDRLWCIRAGLKERQWLKDHPGVWRPLVDVLQEAAAWKPPRSGSRRNDSTRAKPSDPV